MPTEATNTGTTGRSKLRAFRLPTEISDELDYRASMESETATELVVRALRKAWGVPELVHTSKREAARKNRERLEKAAAASAQRAEGAPPDPNCPHPKASLQKLSYMTRCGLCGGRVDVPAPGQGGRTLPPSQDAAGSSPAPGT